MFSTGAWANTGTASITGLDDIDLWVGGLAESTNLFGGLLGSTFNYVFENQLTNLQNGDRFYYLARTPGMNLRTQLEGNSFAELVMRNTNAHTLKADPFATADCKFELERLTFPATTVGSSGVLITGAGSVKDDPLSECDENALLLQMSERHDPVPGAVNSSMPSGINAQAVYNGAAGVVTDRICGGNDNDTFWGGEGNDIIEGGDGADIALGGEGNDIITDLAGDDVPKGGPGNDAIDGGPGLDILMGGEGKDFTNGGANTNETFGGAGDDFVIAGQGLDAVFGDSGDDWEEGGDQPDLLIGDSSTLFFDDHNLPGHDILIGQGGDDDYDLEGGDDIGVAGPGVEKIAGASGYDWQIGLGDPAGRRTWTSPRCSSSAASCCPDVRDKFNEVEALSGWNLNDTLRGDDVVPTAGRRRRLRRLRRARRRRAWTASPASTPWFPPLRAPSTRHRSSPPRRPSTACSPASSGARATSSSAVPAATPSKAAAPTTSSTATSTSTSASASAPTRLTPAPRSAPPT